MSIFIPQPLGARGIVMIMTNGQAVGWLVGRMIGWADGRKQNSGPNV